MSAPTPKAAAPTPQRRAAKSPARAQPKATPDDEGDQVGGAQKNRAKYQLDRLQESHDALKQRCDVLLLGLLVLTLLVVWSNYCTQTFFTNEYGRDAFCIFMALCFILSSENKESITALSKPKRYFLIFFGSMLFFELFLEQLNPRFNLTIFWYVECFQNSAVCVFSRPLRSSP